MIDYSIYRLKAASEIEQLERQYGEKFLRLKEAVHSYLKGLPCDNWIDFTKRTTQKNIPAFIKIVCDYIDHNSTVFDFVEFNSTFSMIRRKEKPVFFTIKVEPEEDETQEEE